MTYRELVAYIKSIPPESALGRAVLGEAADWTATTYLLADVVDLLNIANWQRSGTKKKAPKPIPRPKQQVYGDRPPGRPDLEVVPDDRPSLGPPTLRYRLKTGDGLAQVVDAEEGDVEWIGLDAEQAREIADGFNRIETEVADGHDDPQPHGQHHRERPVDEAGRQDHPGV